MPRRFTPVNGSAGPSQAPRARRRSPRATGLARMQEFVDALKESIARPGDLVRPDGIGPQNAVIANIIENGVPEAHSLEKRRWTADENNFVWHAHDWNQGIVAAYLGRSNQACRIRRCREIKRREALAQQGTGVMQNAALQPPAPVAGSSRSAGPLQESEQLVQMSREELPRWRSWPPLPPIGSPCHSGPAERQNVRPAPMEPPTRTTLDMQDATRAFGMDILAEAAAQVAQVDNVDLEHDVD
ncbi:hypothetical protein KCU65_g8833, partial [Aureobasidium melanogenum]